MPEWLRLFRPTKSAISALRAVPSSVGHVVPFTPRLTPALRNTYILPTATLSGITKKMYTQPLMSVLDNPSSEIMDPFFSRQREEFRSSLGIPQGYIDGAQLTSDQARNILRIGASNIGYNPLDFSQRLNEGLQPGDPRELSYGSVLNNAGYTYARARENTPYGSVQEYLDDVPLFNVTGMRAGHPVRLDAAVNGFANGIDITTIPEFDRVRDSATRMAFNRGFIDLDHPAVQDLLNSSIYIDRYNPQRAFDEIGSIAEAGNDAARDTSYGAVKKLSRFAGRYLTTPEKTKLLMQVLPDGISLEDLTPEQIKELKKIIRPDSGVGNMISHPYSKRFLDTMANLESLPEKEREPILAAINSAYKAPAPLDNVDPYTNVVINRYAEKFKNAGIDITPEELKLAFNVQDPRYPEVSAKLRAKGFELLPGDIQHMSWFQMQNANDAIASWSPESYLSSNAFDNWTDAQKNQFVQRAKEIVAPMIQSQSLIRTAIQARALEKAMPRGTGIFETNTSPDSYKLNLKTAVTSPLYGLGPGKIRLWPLSENGDLTRMYGNNLQLNRLRFDSNGNSVSTLNLPEVQQNTFTISDLRDLRSIFLTNPSEGIKILLDQSPAAKESLVRVLNSAKAVREHDRSSVARVFDIANKKNRTLGLPEVTFPTITHPIYPDQEGFYDPENIAAIRELLRDMDSMLGTWSDGWAPRMRRIPMGSLKQKQGGKIPNWIRRYIR